MATKPRVVEPRTDRPTGVDAIFGEAYTKRMARDGTCVSKTPGKWIQLS